LGIPVAAIVMSVPLILAKIPRNGLYGFRTPKTMSSDEMWYRTNKLGGKYLLAAGAVQVAGLAMVAWAAPPAEVSAVSSLAVILAPLLTSFLIWNLQIRKY
jgi:uncharacterized membrane protein